MQLLCAITLFANHVLEEEVDELEEEVDDLEEDQGNY